MSTTTSGGAWRAVRDRYRVLTRLTGLPPSSVVVFGHDVGHIGPADIIVGFDRLCRTAFGFGLITPPAG